MWSQQKCTEFNHSVLNVRKELGELDLEKRGNCMQQWKMIHSCVCFSDCV